MQIHGDTVWVYGNPQVLEAGRSIHTDEGPLDRAVRDLARDWRDVFGANPTALGNHDGRSRLVIGRDAILALGGNPRQLAAEQWAVEILPIQNGELAVCLYGGEIRGDVFAVYQFSHQFLGVDKFHHWRDTVPGERSTVTIQPTISEPPMFRWRGFFLNDEDLLTGWDPDPSGATGVSIGTWDRVFETLLRCGGNFVVPGTFLFPDEAHVRLASDRGLAIGQHHIEVLGLNTFRWDDGVPYSFVENPEAMTEAWRSAVAQYGEIEVVWSVGYRGKHDRPFWRDDELVQDSAAARGRVITEAIRAQVDIVRAARPNDTIVHHLWMEGVELYEEGSLQIPDGVRIVWPDDGFGFVRDGGKVGRSDGAYYHVAMFNRFVNQLTEAVPVERIGSELSRLAAAGATSHLLVNVSDIRPCLLTAEAAMDFAWSPPTPVEAGTYVDRWAVRLHGVTVGTAVAALWKRYFDVGWRPTEDRPHRLEDNGYHTFSRMILAELAGGPTFSFEESRLPELVPDHAVYRPFREATTTREAAKLLHDGTESVRNGWRDLVDDVDTFLVSLDDPDRGVVRSHLWMQIRFHALANEMLHEVAAAFVSLDSGEPDAWRGRIENADRSIRYQLSMMRELEYGRWRGWYAGDLFVDVAYTLQLVQMLLETGPRSLPAHPRGSVERPWPPVLRTADPYDAIKAYQGDRRVGGIDGDPAAPLDGP